VGGSGNSAVSREAAAAPREVTVMMQHQGRGGEGGDGAALRD
jgi:hypothetical protein